MKAAIAPPGTPAPAGAGELHLAWPPLPRDAFARPCVDLARALLGMVLIREDASGVTAGAIVETEAYAGPEDRASHARAGQTRRTAPLFGPAGHAYVYLVYGIHDCVNVVAEGDGRAGAVLVRALEPLTGIDLMRARRAPTRDPDSRLAAGPGRLCRAMGITRDLDAIDLTVADRLWIAAPDAALAARLGAAPVVCGPRIGVEYAGSDWAPLAWRFGVGGHPSLSRPFPTSAGLD